MQNDTGIGRDHGYANDEEFIDAANGRTRSPPRPAHPDRTPNPRTYNASGLKRALRSLEQNYGMTSDEFYNASEADDTERLKHIPRFTQHTWRSLYIEKGDRG